MKSRNVVRRLQPGIDDIRGIAGKVRDNTCGVWTINPVVARTRLKDNCSCTLHVSRVNHVGSTCNIKGCCSTSVLLYVNSVELIASRSCSDISSSSGTRPHLTTVELVGIWRSQIV